jgi:hypothetical protein
VRSKRTTLNAAGMQALFAVHHCGNNAQAGLDSLTLGELSVSRGPPSRSSAQYLRPDVSRTRQSQSPTTKPPRLGTRTAWQVFLSSRIQPRPALSRRATALRGNASASFPRRIGAELDRPLYAAELFRGRFRRGGDASGIAPFRWEEIGAVLTLTVRACRGNTSEL